MNNGYSPILITTPRTGSSLLTHYLAQIGKQTANYQNNLSEFFDNAPWNNLRFKQFKYFGKKIIGLETNQQIIKLEKNAYDSLNDIEYKFNMLKENEYKYMIKIIPYMLDPKIIQYCFENYNFVYLERRDKFRQLLSYMSIIDSKISHYDINSKEKILKIRFDTNIVGVLDKLYKEYFKIKNQYPGPVLFYEDIMVPDIKLKNIIEELNINEPIDFRMIEMHSTRTSIYNDIDLENLIENKDDYLKYKTEIKEMIDSWSEDKY